MSQGEIKRIGGSGMGPQREVKILGAQPIEGNDNPEIRDSRSPVEPTPMHVHIHEERITEADKLRSPRREPTDPEVRVRDDAGTFQKALEDE